MARRRRLTATPLLVAGTGTAVSLACAGGPVIDTFPVGNLMAPPSTTVCLDVTPDDATITIDGIERVEGCSEIYAFGSASLSVTADGYVPHAETLTLPEGGQISVTVTLDPDE